MYKSKGKGETQVCFDCVGIARGVPLSVASSSDSIMTSMASLLVIIDWCWC